MNQQKHTRKPSVRRRTSSKSAKGRNSFLTATFASHPRTAWWLGGIAVMCLYIWLFYSFFVSPTGFRWRALFGDVNYPAGYEIHGIDISHYQGDIDWDRLRGGMIEGCPLRFIMIKSTEGSSRMDSKFRDNFRQAREYGYIRGAYHFGATSRLHATRHTSSSTTYTLKKVTCLQFSTSNTCPKTVPWKTSNATFSHGSTLLRTVITSNPSSTHIINLRSVISTPPSLTTILTG